MELSDCRQYMNIITKIGEFVLSLNGPSTIHYQVHTIVSSTGPTKRSDWAVQCNILGTTQNGITIRDPVLEFTTSNLEDKIQDEELKSIYSSKQFENLFEQL